MIKKILFWIIVILLIAGCQVSTRERSAKNGLLGNETNLAETLTASSFPTTFATTAITPAISLDPGATPTPDPYWFDDENEYWPQDPLGREYYAFAWRGEERIPEFNQTILDAYANGEAWATDPIEAALRFAGYPNPDDIYPEAVYVFFHGSLVIVVVRTGRVWDDSIFEQEHRIDLVKDGETWRIEWAGYRQRCARYAGPGDWMVGLCP
jgi:hypothetical protein